MAKPTTHKLESVDTPTAWLRCTRCGKESGNKNRGIADYFMGVCQSEEAVLETPEQAKYHEEVKASKAQAIADMQATPRQVGYLQALLEKNPLTARDLGIHGIPSNLSKANASAMIELLK